MDNQTRPSRKATFSWMMFDWAAQPYHTLIITFIFAPYFTAFVAADAVSGQAQWAFATTIAGICIAITAPILGALADTNGRRKPWIAAFSLLAIVGACGLWLATPGGTAPIVWVLTAFVIGLIGIEIATIFSNAMMPSLVSREELGKLSGSGWALGYVGGVVSLIIMLAFMSANAETGKTLLGLSPVLGLDPVLHEGDRAAGPLTAIWYLIFVIPLFLFTPDGQNKDRRFSVSKGLSQLINTLKSLPKERSLFSFLMSSMLYRDGLNALYVFGGIYAAGVLGLSIIQIGIFGILAAVSGAVGAFVGGRMDARFGPRPVVFVSCWLLVFASLLVVSTTKDVTLFFIPLGEGNWPLINFYFAGAIIGAAGGTLQAASRTLLIDQVPTNKITEAFGLYALSGRATAFIGPLLVGIITTATQSQRIGITPVIALLVLGAIGLIFVRQNGDNQV